jgi:hypothetical protein
MEQIEDDCLSRPNLAHHAAHGDNGRQTGKHSQNPFHACGTEPRYENLQHCPA